MVTYGNIYRIFILYYIILYYIYILYIYILYKYYIYKLYIYYLYYIYYIYLYIYILYIIYLYIFIYYIIFILYIILYLYYNILYIFILYKYYKYLQICACAWVSIHTYISQLCLLRRPNSNTSVTISLPSMRSWFPKPFSSKRNQSHTRCYSYTRWDWSILFQKIKCSKRQKDEAQQRNIRANLKEPPVAKPGMI